MAKVLSLDEVRRRLSQFVASWRDAEGYERGEAQQFVRDLLSCFGLTKRTAALYERRAQRVTTGHRGYIDALIPGQLVIEMKGAGKDLLKAEDQAFDYLDSLSKLETPRFVLTSNFHSFRLADVENTQAATSFTLEDLPLHAEELGFLAGHQTRTFGHQEQERASVQAAQMMGGLYQEVAKAGLTDHEASIFLVRTLFCLYADDAGLWRRDLFLEFLEERTSEDGTDLGAQLSTLYQLLNQPEDRRPATLDELLVQFPYVNGGIFGQPLTIPLFAKAMRDKLIECCSFNWEAISPAVFGSLFQAVKDSAARRHLGEHYTTETNILKLLEPLFLDELRERFRREAHNTAGLQRLLNDLGQIRVADMSCGCGNFLVVALREMRELELEIREQIAHLDTGELQTDLLAHQALHVQLSHFIGAEIEEWPAHIATTALYLADHQANRKMANRLGYAPDPLPLVTNRSIFNVNALRTDWRTLMPPTASTYVVGNPPFVGQYGKDAHQVEDLKAVWGSDYDGYLDYVTGWYKKAIDFFGPYLPGRFAFVSTNSITQGQPVPALFGPIFAAGWRIRFAHQTFAWTSEAPDAAAVHCVIIGFDREKKPTPVLFSYEAPKGEPTAHPAKAINAYLSDGANILVTKRMKPLSLPVVSYGSKPADGGFLIVEPDQIDKVLADPIAAKYVRRFVGAKELLHNHLRWCLWLEDVNPGDIQRSSVLHERVQGVRNFRLTSKKRATQEAAATPYLFQERRQPTVPYLMIPSHVSETRLFYIADRFQPEVIANNSVFTCPDPDGLVFAVISSSMFITWQRMIGGRLESRLRFSNTVVWNNFPMPALNDRQRAEIIAAGQGVLDARALRPDLSLADHYNPLAMSPELLKAHAALDRKVDSAFGRNAAQDRPAALANAYSSSLTADRS